MNCQSCGSSHLKELPNGHLKCESCGAIQLKSSPNPNTLIDFELINQSVFRIKSGKKTGTGFIIHQDGYFVTNAHIVKDSKTCTVIFEDDTTYEADIMHLAEEPTDLAIGKIKSKDTFKPLNIATEAPKIAQTIYAIGNPKNLGLSVSKGTLSRKTDSEYQCDLTVNPGNSGGPILNEEGNVVGVVSYVLKEVQGLAFAVSLDLFLGFLKTPKIKALEPLVYEKRQDLKRIPINTLAFRLKRPFKYPTKMVLSIGVTFVFLLLLLNGLLNQSPVVIEFTDGFGSVIQRVSLEEGSQIDYPEPPFKEGYSFKGWSENEETASKDLRIVPLYEPLDIEITFDYGHKLVVHTTKAFTDLSDINGLENGFDGFYLDRLETIPLNEIRLVTDTTIYVSPHLDSDYYLKSITRGSIIYYLPEFAQIETFDKVYQVGERIDDLPLVYAGDRLFEGWMAKGEIITLPYDLESSSPMHLTPVFSNAELDYFYYTEEGTFLERPSVTNAQPVSNLDLDYAYFWPEIPDIFNHKVYIIGINGTEPNIKIPTHIHNREVISIQTGSPNIINFNGYEPRQNEYIETLELPNSIRFVYQLHLPMLNAFIIDDDHPYLNLVYGALYTESYRELIKFPATLNKETFMILKDVEIIRDYAFNGQVYLSEITAEEGSALREIGSRSFFNMSNLENIFIPRYVDTIKQEAFSKLPNLKAFEVDERNLTYEAIEGALVRRQGKALMYLNPKTDNEIYVIPDNIKSVELGAIYGTQLKEIHFTESSDLEYIYHYAIINNALLETVRLPGTIQTLYGEAFSSNMALTRLEILPSSNDEVIQFISNYLPSPSFDGTIDPELFGFFGVIPAIVIEDRLLDLYLEDLVFSYYQDYFITE